MTLSVTSHIVSSIRHGQRRSIDVEQLLIWTYQRQQVDQAERRGRRALRPGGARSNMGAIQRIGLQGVRVDCDGSAGYGADAVHADAQAVHDAVLAMGPDLAALIVEHARAGTRPDALLGAETQILPRDVTRKGKPKVEWSRCRNYPVIVWLKVINHPDYLASVRKRYRTWWHALAYLAEGLGALAEYRVTGPAAPEKPWVGV